MKVQFQCDGWDAPIVVEVEETVSGVHATAGDFHYSGSHEQWACFRNMGWVRDLP